MKKTLVVTIIGLLCLSMFSIAHAPPPTTHPYMGIEHDAGFGAQMSAGFTPDVWPVTWGPSPQSAEGSGFTASLIIKTLDAAWDLWNASFTLSYNSTVIDVNGGLGNITIDSNWLGSTKTYAPGMITIHVQNYSSTAAGNVPVAEVKFTIKTQGSVPPLPSGHYDESKLTYGNVKFFGHSNTPIPAGASDSRGRAKIYAKCTPLPYLRVSPGCIVLDPPPIIDSTFFVNVTLTNMTMLLHDVAVQFRLQYNSTVLSLVNVTEGPFLTNPIWDKYGTVFASVNTLGDPVFGDHVAVLDLLLPNGTGQYDQAVFPNTIENPSVDNQTLATFCFKVLVNSLFNGVNFSTYLNLPPFWLPEDNIFIDENASYIPSELGINGTIRMPGDVDTNGKVNGNDVAYAAYHFGSYGPDFLYPGSPASPSWYLNADENENNKIDGKDIWLISHAFGKAYP